jgi:hypothetical protein
MFDNVVVVYKYIGDLMFYVTGSHDENELILHTVLQAFYESVSILLRCALAMCGGCKVPVGSVCRRASPWAQGRFDCRHVRCLHALRRQQVEKKTVLENLDLVLLAVDEIVDGG